MYAHTYTASLCVRYEYRCHHPSIGRKANAASSSRYSLVMYSKGHTHDTFIFQHRGHFRFPLVYVYSTSICIDMHDQK